MGFLNNTPQLLQLGLIKVKIAVQSLDDEFLRPPRFTSQNAFHPVPVDGTRHEAARERTEEEYDNDAGDRLPPFHLTHLSGKP